MSETWERSPSAVVLVVDRLSPAFLGPYGNTWLETATYCQLASQGIVAETVVAHVPTLEGAYSAYWQGWPGVANTIASPSDAGASPKFPFLEAAKQSGRKLLLVTDDPQVTSLPGAEQFDECLLVKQQNLLQPASEVEETPFANMAAEVVQVLRSVQGPFLLWVHFRGMAEAWDAPPEFRNQFADEDDPLPGDFVQPPEQWIPKEFDPDELLGVQHAYAGQVSLLDLCLEEILTAIDELPAERQAMVALTSPRGYPLGEHLQIGSMHADLYSELIQLPLIVRHPQKYAQLTRVQELLQPADLCTTLMEGLRLDLPVLISAAPSGGLFSLAFAPQESQRSIAVCVSDDEWAVRTYAWQLRQKGSWKEQASVKKEASEEDAGEEESGELYVKPDDRFEVVEIASRRLQIVPWQREAGRAFLASLMAGKVQADLPQHPQLSDTWH